MDAPRYVTKMLEEVGCEAEITISLGDPATAWGFTIAVKGNSEILKKLTALGWAKGWGYVTRACGCRHINCSCKGRVKRTEMRYRKGANPAKEAEYGE